MAAVPRVALEGFGEAVEAGAAFGLAFECHFEAGAGFGLAAHLEEDLTH